MRKVLQVQDKSRNEAERRRRKERLRHHPQQETVKIKKETAAPSTRTEVQSYTNTTPLQVREETTSHRRMGFWDWVLMREGTFFSRLFHRWNR